MRINKKLLINLSVSLCSVLIVLTIAEIVMRFAWKMGGWVERPVYRRSQNPYLRYELIPNATSGNIRINSGGFRGREYPSAKPAQTFRIAMLGDSETLCYKLEENETLAAQLEDLLNKNSAPLKYEVLNFGIEGYSTLQEAEQLRTKALNYQPDLIILNYVLNDPEPGEYYFEKNFLMRHSALVRYFSYRIKKALIRKERKAKHIDTEIDNYYYYHQPKYFNHTKAAILEMAQISKGIGRKLIVVIFPTSSIMVKDFRENYPYQKLHELVKSIHSDNIIFIDLIDEYNRLNLGPQDVAINYAYDESHKNAACLKTSAAYIYEILRSNKVLPQ